MPIMARRETRTIADMVTNTTGVSLTSYRATKMMKLLGLVSCQAQKHQYRKAAQKCVEIANYLGASTGTTEAELVALERGYPQQLRMDNGPEFISLILADWADEHRIKLEFIKLGTPTQNAYIERFNRTYRTEILDFYLFSSMSEVREITDRWCREYNEERPMNH